MGRSTLLKRGDYVNQIKEMIDRWALLKEQDKDAYLLLVNLSVFLGVQIGAVAVSILWLCFK